MRFALLVLVALPCYAATPATVVDSKIDFAQSHPDDPQATLEALRSLRDFLREGGDRDVGVLKLPVVLRLVDATVATRPSDAPLLLVEKASLMFNLGRKAEVEPLLDASMKARPNLEAGLALMGIYSRREQRQRVIPVCEAVRPQLFREEQVFALLDACIRFSGALTPESGLNWTSADDKRFYFKKKQSSPEQQRAPDDGKRQPLLSAPVGSPDAGVAPSSRCTDRQQREMRESGMPESAIESACQQP